MTGKKKRRSTVRPANVSIGTVAAHAGVSVATVSRVINGIPNRASTATAERVTASIAELNYRPHRAGKTLRQGRSQIVALFVPDPANAYNSAIAASLEQELRRQGQTMVLCGTWERPDLQDELLLEMRSLATRGIVMLGALPSPRLEQFLDAGEPIVFANRPNPGVLPAPFVGIDNAAAGADVARMLLETGPGPYAILQGPLNSRATSDRAHAFRSTLKAAGHPVDKRYVFERPSHADPIAASYRIAADMLALDPRPRAIFCTTDETAFGVYRRCREAGIDVPGDLILVGFDGNPLNVYLAPWLRTVQVPYHLFGAAISELLGDLWRTPPAEPRQIILPYKLSD